MKLLVYGDLHLESQGFQPKKAWLDEVDVVLQTGDIHYGTSPLKWLNALNKKAFFVPGNHEYWNPVAGVEHHPMMYSWGGGGSSRSFRLRETHPADALDEEFRKTSGNVTVLVGRVEVFEGVRFVGTTLWFNPDGNEKYAESVMYDFKRIRSSAGVPWTAADVRKRHSEAVGFLTDVLEEPFDGKTVVMTHHAPSLKSTEDGGESSDDFLYGTNLEHLVSLADLWVHGHVHRKNDYMVGKCRVLSNPRGHPDEKSRKTFNKNLVVEL